MTTRSIRLAVTERLQVSNVDVEPGVYDGQAVDQPSADDPDTGEVQYFMDVPHSIMEVGMVMATVRTVEVTEQVNNRLIIPEA